jgi:hypothetical protein
MKKCKVFDKMSILLVILMFMINFYFINAQEEISVISKEEASTYLNKINQIIISLEEQDLPTLYIQDKFLEAQRIFNQSYYIEILNDNNSNATLKKEARDALLLVDWKNINYMDIKVIYNEVEERKNKEIEVNDLITALERRIDEKSQAGLNNTKALSLLVGAKTAFKEDRVEEANQLVTNARAEFESETSKRATLAAFSNSLKNFIQKYWFYIIAGLILLFFIIKYLLKRWKIIKLKNLIKKLNSESKVLHELIVGAQMERYKENKISGLVYNMRTKKYNERLQEIEQQLPVFVDNLNKLLKNK